MKKIVSIIFALLMIFALTACVGAPEENPSTDLKFSNTTDYSSKQGYKNWYFYCGDVEENDMTMMTYSSYHARYNSIYSNIYYDNYIMREYWLLGETGQGVALGFKAPYSREAEISVEFTLMSSNATSSFGLQLYSNIADDGYPGEFHDSMILHYTEYGEANKLTENFKYKTEKDEMLYFSYYGSVQAYAKVIIKIEYPEN